MKKQHIKKRHSFYFWIVRPVAWMLALKYHYRTKPRKLKKKEQYFILANHQGVLDPVFLSYSFKNPIYFVANETLFNSKLYSKILIHCFAPIKKKKGLMDVECIREMRRVAKEGGNVCIFPEGNRAWCDFQFFIDPAIAKLIRMIGLPVMIYNFEGGYGVNPRWSKGIRKGKYIGGVKEIISLEEIQSLDNDTLYQRIVDDLKVIDSKSGAIFKSKKRAEYLERQLFICPKCHQISTITSHKNQIQCQNCDLEVTYTEQLKLTSSDKNFKFLYVVDWYKFQLEEIKKMKIEEHKTICEDEKITAYEMTLDRKRIFIGKGRIVLSKEKLQICDTEISVKDIIYSSITGGRKLIVNTIHKSYFIIGPERFNPIKYLLFFNVVCERIATAGGDSYYGLCINDSNC